MKFTKTEKLLLFAFGCSDRAETFCRLGAASGAVQCEPFTEKCEALRRKLQVHQEPEENGLMSLSNYDRVCPFIEMGKSILLAVCFDEEIKKDRVSVNLKKPVSDETRKKRSEAAKARGLGKSDNSEQHL